MKLHTGSYFFKTFILLFTTMATIFSLFAVYIYNSSTKVIENEFINSNSNTLDKLVNYVDQTFIDSQKTLKSLESDSSLQDTIYLSSDYIYSNYTRRLQESFHTLKENNDAIEAIYFYSEYSGKIYGHTGSSNAKSHYDRYWIDMLAPDEKGISIFPYAMRNQFPHVLCVAQTFYIDNSLCALCLMLNISKLPLLEDLQTYNGQSFFIIADDNTILYQKSPSTLQASTSTSEELICYDESLPTLSVLHTGRNKTPYCYSQQASDRYPWSYVLYTPLPDYTARLSSSNTFAILLAFIFILLAALIAAFFCMHAMKPVRTIRNLLDDPSLLSPESISNSHTDIKYIADKITQYVQTNEQLATELDSRIHLLDETQKQALQLQINPHFLFNTLGMLQSSVIEIVGYEHDLPMMIQDLSSLLRYSLEPSHMVSLEKELWFTDIYLNLLNHRYEKRLVITKQISPEVLPAKVPRLFIQPIIENAVFHGFSKQYDSTCSLEIRCNVKNTDGTTDISNKIVCLQIIDNGVGIKEDLLTQLNDCLAGRAEFDKKNIGLRNVSQRLDLFFAGDATINIKSAPNEGTEFTITYPFIP